MTRQQFNDFKRNYQHIPLFKPLIHAAEKALNQQEKELTATIATLKAQIKALTASVAS